MADLTTCLVCGEPDHDNVCLDCTRVARSILTLGHAIARFVRRAEVDGLVETVRRTTSQAYTWAEWAGEAGNDRERRMYQEDVMTAVAEQSAALTRLAALALGGGS